jgi:predicted NUDIX family NTP pyrophosphohydrolase
MRKHSAGILMFRRKPTAKVELLLVHPGGPFWAKKDESSWSLPKGEFSDDEDALLAARREFQEETGATVDGDFLTLSPVKQKSGKTIFAWAVEGDWDPRSLSSNTFELEWPRGSGKVRSYPEVDKAGWFDARTARIKLHPGQVAFVDQLLHLLGITEAESSGNGSTPEQLKLF